MVESAPRYGDELILEPRCVKLTQAGFALSKPGFFMDGNEESAFERVIRLSDRGSTAEREQSRPP